MEGKRVKEGTAAQGSGMLALLAWSVAQLGWIAGLIALLAFAAITYYTSTLLVDCYRCPGPVNGTRNTTYMSATKLYICTNNILAWLYIAVHKFLWSSGQVYNNFLNKHMRATKLHTHTKNVLASLYIAVHKFVGSSDQVYNNFHYKHNECFLQFFHHVEQIFHHAK